MNHQYAERIGASPAAVLLTPAPTTPRWACGQPPPAGAVDGCSEVQLRFRASTLAPDASGRAGHLLPHQSVANNSTRGCLDDNGRYWRYDPGPGEADPSRPISTHG